MMKESIYLDIEQFQRLDQLALTATFLAAFFLLFCANVKPVLKKYS